MAKLPKSCPSCGQQLVVTRLRCPDCATEVSGQYAPDIFARLTPKDFDFVVLFLKARGNIKEMEREMGVSYWSIRAHLGEVLGQLGLEEATPGGGEGWMLEDDLPHSKS